MFAQCITAMAHHRYLELEGGHKLVEFIVKQCALSDEEVGVFFFSYQKYSFLIAAVCFTCDMEWSNFQFSVQSIRDCIGHTLLSNVIGPENSHYSLNQSEAKLKPRLGRPRFPAL